MVFPQVQGQNKPEWWQRIMVTAERVVGDLVSAEVMKAGISGNWSDSQDPIKF